MTIAPSQPESRASFFGPDEPVIEHRRVRQRRGRRSARLTLTITAMIDVVFLLLIYFIVGTDFRIGEELYRMNVPNARGAGEADPFTLDDQPLRIVVMSTGLSPASYQLRLEGPYPQPENFQALYEFLSDKQVNPRTASLGSGAMFEPDHPVIIQPTRSTRWEHAMEAFNAAARARYTNITFAKPG